MVWHQQEHVGPPQELFLAMTDGRKQFLGDIRQGKLILEPRLAVDGNEIDLHLRINPQWNRMRQGRALRHFHAARIETDAENRKQGSNGVRR